MRIHKRDDSGDLVDPVELLEWFYERRDSTENSIESNDHELTAFGEAVPYNDDLPLEDDVLTSILAGIDPL